MPAKKKIVSQKARRECLAIEAIDPTHGKSIIVFISYDRLHAVAVRSRGQVKDAAYNVPEVLQAPAGVFEGLLREEDDDNVSVGWRCYSGIPSHGYKRNGKAVPPWPDEVFLVFVNHDNIAYNWYWTKCDPSDSCFPENYKTRFKRCLL